MTQRAASVDRKAIEDIVTWLVSARRFEGPREVLTELSERLLDAGVDIYRSAVFIRTLHPSIMGRRYDWDLGKGVSLVQAPYEVLQWASFKTSPIEFVYQRGEPVRLRLADKPTGYNYIDDLRAEKATDYLMLPLFFTNGETHAISWSTRRPGGFLQDEIDAFAAVAAPFSRATEIYALRRTALTLLDTYVGHGAGGRILSGKILRGDTEEIDAVILAADLRGFSSYTNSHDGMSVTERLNAFFDLLVEPITEHGGEVLKFMGDGLLAMFPYADASEQRKRCREALAAAQKSIAALDQDASSDEAIKCGIALHPGHVLFGNVGSNTRLDFTAIGEAVNMAARLENVAAEQGRAIVVSADFVSAVGSDFESLGCFQLKGFEGEHEVFVPA